ncbi:MAG TPA: acetate/propionate family kinase [Planctomycetaceae bacterium]|nr:acetate/propionate family kinase [Planctomycetaceae bacterium]HIQ20628.1 acetate/propionate family kinase [Planctomycetota bacterium]
MKILVANLGSTSFKYRLFDMRDQRQLARGGIERIGSPESLCRVEIGDHRQETTLEVPDHAEAVRQCLAQLTDPAAGCLRDASEVSAIGFKAVHGGRFTGVQRVTDELLDAMEQMSPVAPAHNPPYIRAMRLVHQKLPHIPLVAAFETDFHRTIPDRNRYYAVPYGWAEEAGVRRWGFHGASHRYIATRTAELLGRDRLRIISCHLGGSSSLCAIRDGRSVANSLGMSPQTGVPHNNRVGDFDPFAIPVVMRHTGMSLEEVLEALATRSGLLGLSGTSGDVRDISQAAEGGDARARLALDVFASSVRHYLGAYLVELGGADVIVFTGGIGENQPNVRAMVCRDLERLGIVLDQEANATARGEAAIHAPESRVQIRVIPTNEELIVARQAKQLLEGEKSCS